MALTPETKQQIVQDFATHPGDTGSPEVQIALLTQRISGLSEHLQQHGQDFDSRQSLLVLVGQRNRLLRYLQKEDRQRYLDLIRRLGLRK